MEYIDIHLCGGGRGFFQGPLVQFLEQELYFPLGKLVPILFSIPKPLVDGLWPHAPDLGSRLRPGQSVYSML